MVNKLISRSEILVVKIFILIAISFDFSTIESRFFFNLKKRRTCTMFKIREEIGKSDGDKGE